MLWKFWKKNYFQLRILYSPKLSIKNEKIIKKLSGQEKLLKNCQLLYVPLYNIYLKCYLAKTRNKIRKKNTWSPTQESNDSKCEKRAVRQVWGDGACGAGGAGAGNSKEDALARRSIELISILEILKELGNMIAIGNPPKKCNFKFYVRKTHQDCTRECNYNLLHSFTANYIHIFITV